MSALAMSDSFTRRKFLHRSTAAIASIALSRSIFADDAPPTTHFTNQRYRISACDWMMLKRQKLGAFKLAKECGLDGVEVDMGGLGDRPTFDNQLIKPDVRQQFLDASREFGIEISSLAMSGFYAQSFP